MTRRRTAILISNRGSNMRALIEAARASDFPAGIALVLSNRPDADGLAFAKKSGIATAAVDHKIYAGRDDFEATIQRLLDLHRIELICLAGSTRMRGRWPTMSRNTAAPCISSCRRSMPARSSRRHACRCGPATMLSYSPHACWKRSIDSTRELWRWWRAAR